MRLQNDAPLALLLALAVSAPASAAYRVGLSEQSAGVFADGAWQPLKLKRVALHRAVGLVTATPTSSPVADQYLHGRARRQQDILLTFTAARAASSTASTRRRRRAARRASSAYKRQFRAFTAQYPFIKSYSVWNEINHVSQPTSSSPKLRRRLLQRRPQLLQGLQDRWPPTCSTQSNLVATCASSSALAKGNPRLWGLHNYKDVNRNRSTGLRGCCARSRARSG